MQGAGGAGAPGGLRTRMMRGSAWTLLGYGTGETLRLASNVVLARLLFPEAFGLMALVNAFRRGLSMVSDVGIETGVVRSSRADDRPFLDTAWTLQLLRGLLLWVTASAVAIPVAHLYREPMLAQLLPVAAFTLAISGFNSTSLPRMRRHLQLGRYQAIDLVGQVTGLVFMIAWVWVRPTVWGLVFGGWAAAITRLVLSHALAPDRDRVGWDRSAARELLSFGAWLLIATLLTFVADEGDRLLLGRLISLGDLGVYNIAATFAALPALVITRIGNNVVFPALSEQRDAGSERLAKTFARTQRTVHLAGAAAISVGVAIAPVAVSVLYDARYQAAGWMIQGLAAGAWWRILAASRNASLLALGAGRGVAVGNGAKAIGVMVGLPLGFMALGLPGAIAGLAFSDFLRWAAMTWVTTTQGLGRAGADLATSVGLGATALLGAWVAAHAPIAPLAGGALGALVAGTPWLLAGLLVARRYGLLPGLSRQG